MPNTQMDPLHFKKTNVYQSLFFYISSLVEIYNVKELKFVKELVQSMENRRVDSSSIMAM